MNERDKVLNLVRDAVACLMYYDRKEDEDLPRGRIEQLLADGALSVDDMIDTFATELRAAVQQAKHARLDPTGTAQGRTRLLRHVACKHGDGVVSNCADTYEAEDGTQIPLSAR